MIDVWTVYWRAPEDKHNDIAMITWYQLKTNANVRLTNIAASDALRRGHSMCWNEATKGPPGVWTFRPLGSNCILRSSRLLFFVKPYKHFTSFHLSFWASSKLILTFTKWGGVACETNSFTVHNATSVYGIQLPSTVDNFRQHLLHHIHTHFVQDFNWDLFSLKNDSDTSLFQYLILKIQVKGNTQFSWLV